MKLLKYKVMREVNYGTEESPNIAQSFHNCEIHTTEENYETNLASAKADAYNGEVIVEDDGQPEPEVQQTPEERIAELEEALDMLLNGVTE